MQILTAQMLRDKLIFKGDLTVDEMCAEFKMSYLDVWVVVLVALDKGFIKPLRESITSKWTSVVKELR
jgi:predicted DNA-binding transcriptional regulator